MPIKTKRCAGACGALALAVLCCCGRHSPDPTPTPQDDWIRIGWIHPADGDSLADTIRTEILVDGPAPERIALAVNGEILVERDRPPWRLQCLPALATAQKLHLLATAHGTTEETASSPGIEIWWRPNHPPVVRFLAPIGARAVERSWADSLIAEAVDPEEGRLSGSALTWISNKQGLLGYGDRIPLGALVIARHRLRVRATDSWQRSGWAERDLEVFEYQDGATPQGTLDDMRYALIANDPGVYEGSLAPGFRFVFCLSDWLDDPEVPSRWDRDDEGAFVRTVLEGNDNDLVTVDWTVASVQPAIIDEQDWVKAELVGIDITLVLDAIDTLSVVNGLARVYLSHAGRWRVEQWQDLGGDAGISQGRLRVMTYDHLDKRYLER